MSREHLEEEHSTQGRARTRLDDYETGKEASVREQCKPGMEETEVRRFSLRSRSWGYQTADPCEDFCFYSDLLLKARNGRGT